ncbi:hypothetical protein [Delftia acidovorans]|uniref:Preprotein translocase subunit SecB n=1 Tax=Delftia acidovorans TaxID=80866 RepID=A0AAJ2V8K8_DELAC|nr:hypothetical protein [Delftia acidovorans]MDX4955874.1 hypothetical protein [Delftia acidovorans]
MTELHPIQLRDVSVSQLHLSVHDPILAKRYEGEVELTFKIGTSELDEQDPTLAVGMLVRAVPKDHATDGKPPFEIEIELSGQFEVDLNIFNFEHLPAWSRVNAPFLLMPFVREQLYGLALRAGIRGVILPFYVQPVRPPKT